MSMKFAVKAADYERLLLRWIRSAKEHIYEMPDQPGLACYGPGSNGWGVQTNQKALAAFAMAQAAESFDPLATGMTREEARELALAMLRFSMRSHLVGDYRCTDGTKWGNTWISVLGIERMMHGIEALSPYMTEQDHALLKQVLISESDFLLNEYEIVADVDARTGKNKPESNLWNGALLHRTALMYPDAPNAEGYREKGSQFLMNAISTLADLNDEQTVYDGKKLKDQLVGANFFDSFALHHHGYLNVGYMVICLSNAAMLHFMYRQKGEKAPEALYHHFKELWQLVKGMTFADGRLMRIGGDTRVRYTYCQEYLVPSWLMARDLYGDDEELSDMEAGWLKQVEQEMNWNGDGSFLSDRLQGLANRSPLYYTRLESDRAVCLSMGMAWSELARQRSVPQEGKTERSQAHEPVHAWHDEFHGAYFHRSRTRAASWVWEAAVQPQGLCLPPDASDMAEWSENMAGTIRGLGRVSGQRKGANGGAVFAGGFITWGETIAYTMMNLAESDADEDIARSQFVVAALPDDTHMVILQYMKALDRRSYIQQLQGLHLNMPNDLFNGNERTYYSEHGAHVFAGVGSPRETVRLGSKWVNVDDRIGVVNAYGADEIFIHRPGQRNIGLKPSVKNGEGEDSLYADQICGPFAEGVRSIDANEVLLDTGYLIQSEQKRAQTKAYADRKDLLKKLLLPNPEVRAVQVKGTDGDVYVLLANFGAEPVSIPVPVQRKERPIDVVAGQPAVKRGEDWLAEIGPGEGKLLRISME